MKLLVCVCTCLYVHLLILFLCAENLTSSEKCKVVFVTARVHPGESPSSYVCQGIIYLIRTHTRMHAHTHTHSNETWHLPSGMMDYLTSSEPSAEVLRDELVFKIGQCVCITHPYQYYIRTSYMCTLYTCIRICIYTVCVCVCVCVCVYILIVVLLSISPHAQSRWSVPR